MRPSSGGLPGLLVFMTALIAAIPLRDALGIPTGPADAAIVAGCLGLGYLANRGVARLAPHLADRAR